MSVRLCWWPGLAASIVAFGWLAGGCGDDDGGGAPAATPTVNGGAPASITVTSAAFQDGTQIPREYTCDGAGGSPPLAWGIVPAGAKGLVLFVDDPDAPRSGGFVHWVAYGIPATATGAESGKPPAGATEGENSSGKDGYTPPCPPSGQEHGYHFKVVALDFDQQLPAGKDETDVQQAIAGHVLAQGELVGRYRRK